MNKLYSFLRYFVALAVIVYGFAKLNGAMFTILQSELDKPLGEVSGFWLTWYYFGYSVAYSSLVAWAQIIGRCCSASGARRLQERCCSYL